MKTLHAKSPCCRARIQKFGKRRRRCVKCFSTWRIRRKKRGRKQVRVNSNLAFSYLNKSIPSLRFLASQKSFGKDHAQLMLRGSLEKYVRKGQNSHLGLLPDGEQLILVADAIWYHINEVKYTIYVLLLRPVNSNQAIIMPPIVIKGHECIEGWEEALSTLPEALKTRICALVCDGGTGIVALAKRHNLILQRCHFHLISAIQNYLSPSPRGAHQEYARKLLLLVRGLLYAKDEQEIPNLLQNLQYARNGSRSRGIQRVLGGLIRDWPDYRTYLKFPNLKLPTTSNTAESCIQGIRDLMYRCRGFRTLESLNLWLRAFAIFKKTIRCNGKNQPN